MDLVALAPTWVAAIFVALVLLAALQDAIQLKISNILCAALLLVGLIAAAAFAPTWSLWQNALALVLVLGIGTWLFGLGVLGGGDVKLLAATAFWFDLSSNLGLLVATALFGGLIALLTLGGRAVAGRVGLRSGGFKLKQSADIPYGVAIAAGAILTAFKGGPA